MSIALIIANALIVSLGMLSGLSAAFTVPVSFALMLHHLRKFKFNSLEISKTTLIFALWILCSCFWSITPIQSLKLFLQIAILIFVCLVLLKKINYLIMDNIFYGLGIGLIIAVILFFIEYYTNGFITNNFKAIFSPNSTNKFHLYNLDRGCAILSLSSWLITYIFILNKRYSAFALYYSLFFYLLYISESLASFVGFILASLAFSLIKIKPRFFVNFIKYGLIIGSLLMPVLAYKIDPRVIADNYSLPPSAKHRLFIWHYVAEKIWEKPLFGYGFGSSRAFIINDQDYINYNDERWSPLPLHPHNNIMQILLETGLVGFLLFLGIIYQFFNKISSELDKHQVVTVRIAAFVACFVNYYVIAMISFSMWQLWWVYIGAWLTVMFKWENKVLVTESNTNKK